MIPAPARCSTARAGLQLLVPLLIASALPALAEWGAGAPDAVAAEADGRWRVVFDKGCPPCDCAADGVAP